MTGRPLVFLALVAALVAAPDVRAATSEVSAGGFLVTVQQPVKAPPHRIWEALGDVHRWWNPKHSWSGEAANFSLSLQAGGCFCERWAQGSVEHGRVVYAVEDKLLRLEAALGPLQALAVRGVLAFAIAPADGGTALTVTYRVSGSDSAGLAGWAGPVDGVIAEQARRLARWIETGAPE